MSMIGPCDAFSSSSRATPWGNPADFWRKRAFLMYPHSEADVDPQILASRHPRSDADHPVNRVDELPPWKWKLHAETDPLSQAA